MDWIDIVTTVGFPIAICMACCWFIYTIYNNMQKENNDREERYLDMIAEFNVTQSEMKTTLENINGTVIMLKDEIRSLKDEVDELTND